ncbi:hypothetical protein M885DRAFT_528666 [Pelagophyceae sp. CCMP2097]|nr:hypothetical protein M885DRAFT_528666 [Pelagophyceae sp. CCMP2097]
MGAPGRGRGGKGGRGGASELLRETADELGLLQWPSEGEPAPKWPVMALPNAQRITTGNRGRIRLARELTKECVESPWFALVNGARGAHLPLQPLLDEFALPGGEAGKYFPEELLTSAASTRKKDETQRPAKRMRASSTASNGDNYLDIVEYDQAAAHEAAERGDANADKDGKAAKADGEDEEPVASEAEGEADEGDDYIKDYYDSDNEGGGDDEPAF